MAENALLKDVIVDENVPSDVIEDLSLFAVVANVTGTLTETLDAICVFSASTAVVWVTAVGSCVNSVPWFREFIVVDWNVVAKYTSVEEVVAVVRTVSSWFVWATNVVDIDSEKVVVSCGSTVVADVELMVVGTEAENR